MAEVGASVAAKLTEYLVDPTVWQLQYLFCVGKITINVEIKKEELILKQGRVQERVQEAINRTERIDDEVNRWKNDVKSLIAEVEHLEEQLKANNDCLRGWCPTWRRYCLCKKLAKTTQRMIDLNIKSDHFNPFSHPVIIPDIEYHSSKDFTFFESTKKAHDELWETLQDDDSYMIGLWGMGGSGKTTLVKEVGKKAKESKLFNRVVITTVSQTPDIRKIQGEISDMLGLKLEEETEVGRARRIAMKLQSPEERILIIFDDVWSTLNLEDIGNPFGDEGTRNCKVLLTTRRQEVCSSMDCQKTILLGLLTEGEAWDLFQTHAKVDDGFIEVAQQVVTECSGLPIAIVAMGKCLRRKGLDEMNVVLHKLRHSKPVEEDKAFTCLKLSYDFLRSVEAKSLFLMCAMFPEDHEIIIEDLFRYGVGLDLCKDADSFEIARSQVMVAIKVLIDSSLLMSSVNFGNKKCVKMHDMVRDVALWIASEEHCTIKVNCTKELDKLIVDETVNNCFALSSWYDNKGLLQFLSQLDAPKLEFLLLCSSELLEISHATFEGTKGLKALIIMCTNWFGNIKLRPQSIQHLSNLRTLRLQRWNLHDISFVVSLTRLEVLDLQGSNFKKMPDGIENLKKLKLLDLSNCTIDECCYQVIGRCLQLEELYFNMHFHHSKNENCYEYLMGPTALKKLRRYKLEIGEHSGGLTFQKEGTRSLRLGHLNIFVGAIIKDLAQRAIAIHFYELEGGSKCFTPNIVQVVGGMNELTKLSLHKCSKIECITDETTPHEDTVLHRLDELMILDMGNLKQLCLGPSPFHLFQKLEILSITKCPQLLHIFPADCNLGNLKFLKIFDCPMLTSIFPISSACTLLSLEALQIGLCNELKHVLAGEGGGDAWGNSRFPKLKILSVNNCCKLEYACPVFLVQKFEQLQHLSIENAPRMKFVFGEEQPMHDADETRTILPHLEYLHLQDLPNLVGICSKKYCLRLSAIKTITSQNCPNMKWQEIGGRQLRNEEYNPLTAIESIRLDSCGVESIFPYQTGIKDQIPKFEYLEQLTLKECARLKVVFSTHTLQCLPKLTSVTISCCEELEAIFRENEETPKTLPIGESYLLKLKSLAVSKCNKLKFILSVMISTTTSMLPQLSHLTISDCSQMEEIFRCSNFEDHDIDSEREIKFPNMEHMELKNLPRLVNVCHGFKLHIEEFCRVEVHKCPKLMPIMKATIDWTKESLERKYKLKKYRQLNNNEALNLSQSVLITGDLDIQSHKVEYKWRVIGDDEQEETSKSEMLRSEQQMLGGLVPTKVLCFQYLRSLEVTHVKNLKFLFSMGTIVQNSLPKLTSLTLSDCEELEEIIAENEEHQIMSNIHISFPELRELKVERCNKFKRLFSMSTATIGLSSLRKIELRDLPNLISVCQALQLQVELISDISICNCPKFINLSLGSALHQLAAISELQEPKGDQLRNKEYKPFSAVERIELDNCGVESIFHNQIGVEEQIPTFQYLKELTLENCARLKCVFSAHIYKSLPELTSITISWCEELEAVFSRTEETQKNISITESCLLKLKSLNISECNKLKFVLSFMTSAATSMLPQLSTLTVSDCSQMEEIFKVSDIEDGINNEREITFPNLEHMDLDNLPRLVDVCQGFKLHTGEFYRVEVHDCPKFMPIKRATIGWTKEGLLKEYELKYSQLNNNEALNLPLSILNVGELDIQSPRVEYWRVIGDDEQEETNDPETLKSEQQMSGGLVSTQVLSFQYLRSLEITYSKNLKFVFSMSTIVQNSLPKLNSLTLSGCEELEVIFGRSSEDDANYGETIVFLSLRKIKLRNLPNFMSVCHVALQIKVELSDITICNCPKFVDSSLGWALQPFRIMSLPQVSTEDSNLQISSNADQLPGKEEKGMKMLISRAEYLRLEDSMNLTSVWEGPSFIMFQNLKRLYVVKCRRMKYILPSTVMRGLPCLGYLWIEECEELEEVMSSSEEEHNHFLNESSNNLLCFPQLYYLRVQRCRKLKWLFPSLPSTQRLPKLLELTIKECSQLKGIYNSEDEIHDEGFYNNLLPEQISLTVEDCPIFSETTLAALQSWQRKNEETDGDDNDNDKEEDDDDDDNDNDGSGSGDDSNDDNGGGGGGDDDDGDGDDDDDDEDIV